MTKTFFLLATLFIGAGNSLFAQQATRFHSSVSVGFIGGATGPSLAVQTVNGWQHKTWLAGIGAGLDYYHTRTLPLFIEVKKLLNHKPKAPFAYVDGGYNFRWLTQVEKEGSLVKTSGGLYYEAGIGYEMPALKKHHFFVSAGLSSKQVRNTEQYYFIDDFINTGEFAPTQYHYNYRLQRLVLKAGLRF